MQIYVISLTFSSLSAQPLFVSNTGDISSEQGLLSYVSLTDLREQLTGTDLKPLNRPVIISTISYLLTNALRKIIDPAGRDLFETIFGVLIKLFTPAELRKEKFVKLLNHPSNKLFLPWLRLPDDKL